MYAPPSRPSSAAGGLEWWPLRSLEVSGDGHVVGLGGCVDARGSGHRAALVSGDKHLLALDEEIPVFLPRAFADLLAENP
jgi:hypothetical protein